MLLYPPTKTCRLLHNITSGSGGGIGGRGIGSGGYGGEECKLIKFMSITKLNNICKQNKLP
jgi:hypothetical protein